MCFTIVFKLEFGSSQNSLPTAFLVHNAVSISEYKGYLKLLCLEWNLAVDVYVVLLSHFQTLKINNNPIYSFLKEALHVKEHSQGTEIQVEHFICRSVAYLKNT